MFKRSLTIFALAVSFAVPPVFAGEKLPVPRFVTLKSDEVNVRIGPGTRYPISWVYHREGLPVEVIEEFDDQWRKIRDIEGSTGWVHGNLLDGQRNVMISGKPRILRRAPDEESAALIKAEPMVIGRLLECERDWCRIQIESRKGWIRKKEIWGTYKDETLE